MANMPGPVDFSRATVLVDKNVLWLLYVTFSSTGKQDRNIIVKRKNTLEWPDRAKQNISSQETTYACLKTISKIVSDVLIRFCT